MLFNDLLRITPYHETFALSLAGYLTFYLLFKQTLLKRILIPSRVLKSKEVIWLSYYCSLFHACRTSFYTSSFLLGNISMFDYHLIVVDSVAYAIFDLIIILSNKDEFKSSWKVYLIHHLIMIIAPIYLYYTPLYRMNDISRLMAKSYLSEISTITFNIAWFLIHLEMDNHILCNIAKNVTIFNFLVFRIINFVLILPEIWVNIPNAGIPICCISLLNVYWFLGMCRNHFFGRNIKDETNRN